jgi:hypothetical protein
MSAWVFLSASVPDPRRNPKYFRSADLIAIREAVRALAGAVLPRSRLVFGGHPAITPLIGQIAERMKCIGKVTVYQSRYFSAMFPPDNKVFSKLVEVSAVPGDREGSLRRMRLRMLRSHDFAVGVFIGGMEGVEAEYRLFRKIHPGASALPIGSTGAAAQLLLEAEGSRLSPELRLALGEERVYPTLFRRLITFKDSPRR